LKSGETGMKPRAKATDSEARKGERDPVASAVRAVVAVLVEAYKLVREMLVIPLSLWMMVAEAAGTVVLRAWRLLRPVLVAALRLLRALERWAERRLTPKVAVAAVAVAVLIALAASQWVDYRSVSVGNFAYTGGVEAVAPAPAVDSERAGNAHGWVMIPLAAVGLVLVVAGLAGRRRAALGLCVVGAAAIAISLLVDMPKGLDEGSAAVAYEGAEAHLLEGFWVQIVAGAALIAIGLLLASYLRPARASEKEERRAPKRSRRPKLGAIGKRRPAAGSSA
jgi:hypothetical protein